jgi:hypothetical protein
MVDESADPTFAPSQKQEEEGAKTDQLDLPLRKVSSR